MMAAPVRHLPAGVIKNPAEVHVAPGRTVFRFRSGAKPEIIIEAFGHRLRLFPVTGLAEVRLSRREAASYGAERADASVQHKFAGMTKTLAGALLATGLEHNPCLLYGIAHGPPFPDGKRERFLPVNVLAGAGGGDNRNGVPVIRCGNHDRINIVAGQQLAKIFVPFTGGVLPGTYLLASEKVYNLLRRFPARIAAVPVPGACPVYVADTRNLNLLSLKERSHMTGSHIARTDESKRNAIAGSRAAGASEGGRRNNAGQSKASGKERTGLQKVASISADHCFSESVGGAMLSEKVTLRKFLCRKRKAERDRASGHKR